MNVGSSDKEVEYPSEFRNQAVRWDAELASAERETATWMENARSISDRYTLEHNRVVIDQTILDAEFNILHSNVQTMLPAVFGKTPKPVVSRRHKDSDPVGRVASEMLERALETELDIEVPDSFTNSLNRVAQDLLLIGRGVPWVRFDPEFDNDGGYVGAHTPVDYVLWSDFLNSPRYSWEEVARDGWVARKVNMSREQGVERFGEIFYRIPLNEYPEARETSNSTDKPERVIAKAAVWEIWDMNTRSVIWLCRDYLDSILDHQPDPLGLDGFFPCPMPAYGTLPNDKLVPTPDYLQYRSLADALDMQTRQIAVLTDALRVVGIYDATMEGLGAVLQHDGWIRNKMIPVTNYSALNNQGIESVVSWMPLRPVVEALVALYDARDRNKQVLYEVSGLSDIMRGQVDPREKLGQSRLKGQFASQRLQKKIRVMEICARDTLRIKAEIMAEHYPPELLRQMSGFDFMTEVVKTRETVIEQQQQQMQAYQQQAAQAQQQGMPPPPPPMMGDPETEADMAINTMFQRAHQLLRNERLRGFRIDVETNSTMLVDDDEEKQNRTQFIEGMGAFFEKSVPMVMNFPMIMPAIGELMLLGVRSFRVGRQVETVFEDAIEDMRNAIQQQMSQPQEDPAQAQAQMEAQVAQAKAQVEMQGIQAKSQAEIQKLQANAQVEQIKAQTRLQEIRAKSEAAAEAARIKSELTRAEIETKLIELDVERERLGAQLEAERQKALLQIGQNQGGSNDEG